MSVSVAFPYCFLHWNRTPQNWKQKAAVCHLAERHCCQTGKRWLQILPWVWLGREHHSPQTQSLMWPHLPPYQRPAGHGFYSSELHLALSWTRSPICSQRTASFWAYYHFWSDQKDSLSKFLFLNLSIPAQAYTSHLLWLSAYHLLFPFRPSPSPGQHGHWSGHCLKSNLRMTYFRYIFSAVMTCFGVWYIYCCVSSQSCCCTFYLKCVFSHWI